MMMLGMVTVFLATTDGVWSFDALFGWVLLVVPGVVMSWFVTAPVFLRSRLGTRVAGFSVIVLWGLVQCVLGLFIGMGSVIAAYQGLMPVGTATLLGTGSLGVLALGVHWIKVAKRPWR